MLKYNLEKQFFLCSITFVYSIYLQDPTSRFSTISLRIFKCGSYVSLVSQVIDLKPSIQNVLLLFLRRVMLVSFRRWNWKLNVLLSVVPVKRAILSNKLLTIFSSAEMLQYRMHSAFFIFQEVSQMKMIEYASGGKKKTNKKTTAVKYISEQHILTLKYYSCTVQKSCHWCWGLDFIFYCSNNYQVK